MASDCLLFGSSHHVAFRNIPHAISAKAPPNIQGKYVMGIHSRNSRYTFIVVGNLLPGDIEEGRRDKNTEKRGLSFDLSNL